jgi:hypothetical protein
MKLGFAIIAWHLGAATAGISLPRLFSREKCVDLCIDGISECNGVTVPWGG